MVYKLIIIEKSQIALIYFKDKFYLNIYENEKFKYNLKKIKN